MTRRACRCETTIPPALLEGYACGNAECWRTERVAASFEAFVAELKRRRGESDPAPEQTADPG